MLKTFLSKASSLSLERKIILTRGIAYFLIIMGLPYIVLFILFGLEVSEKVMLGLYTTCFLTLVLIKYRYERLAKLILIFGVSGMLFSYSILLGVDTGAPLIFFPIISLALILFEKNEVKLIFFGSLIPVFFRVILDLITKSQKISQFFSMHFHEDISSFAQMVIYQFAVLTSFSFTFFFVFFYFYSNNQSEKLLEVKNALLSSSVKELNSSNKRLKLNYKRIEKMLDRIRSQKAMEADLEKGRKLQNSTLPQTAPQMLNLTISHAFESAKSLSGDYFDYAPNHATATPIPTAHPQNDDDDADTEPQFIFSQIGIIIADVVGKGVAASLEMFSVKTVFKLLHEHWFNPIELVTRLNTMSTDSHLFSKYVPLIYITLTQLQGNQYQLNAVNAGHEYGVIIKASGEVILLDQGGAPAGMDKDEKYIETQYSLDKNDTVFLFTDGCTDVKSPNGEVIGFDELLPILHQATQQHPKDIARYVRNRLQDFQGKAPQADDMTIVAVFVG
jgi:serine phosphatase RsbU (regulator of sigma subunit)